MGLLKIKIDILYLVVYYSVFDMRKIKHIISDFDNVAYNHTSECFRRQHHTAAIVATAYFGIPYETALIKTEESWNSHKNGFYFALKDHPDMMANVEFHELYRQQQALSQDAKNGIKCDETVDIINDMSAKHSFIFASHSSLRSVQYMGYDIGVNRALMERGTYGMDTLGDNGGQRKDDVFSGIYPWLCKKEEFVPDETLMIEDSHANLKGAKLSGLQTLHIHWGNPVRRDYIDYSFATNLEAFRFVRDVLNNDGVVPTQRRVQKIA